MSSNVAALAAPNGDNGNHQGHCSQCGKVWTLKERQGICQWCLKPASCQYSTSKPRHIKSRSNGRRKQPNGNGNGYEQLPDKWFTYHRIALPFAKSVPTQDSEDLLHTIIMTLADVARNGEVSEAAMYRIASYTKADYWRAQYRHSKGLDCGSCNQAQRRKCKEDWLYGECPKAVKVESLNKPIIDSEGNLTELGELIADDKAIDLDAWADARTFMLGAPERLKGIAYKLTAGEVLTPAESRYLYKWRRREQKKVTLGGEISTPNTDYYSGSTVKASVSQLDGSPPAKALCGGQADY
jgi:hypothetical protein